MDVKVLGPGCAKCEKLFDEARKAVEQSGTDATLIKVDKLDDIIAYGVMITPALVIDDMVRSTGKVPGADEIAGWIREAAAKE